MGILNVDNIQPVGGGTTITLNSSEINVGAGITLESNGQAIFAGIVTATHFYGSGANLTGLPAGTTINNNAANRIITGEGGTTLNGEANLLFDGGTLALNGRYQRGSATVQDGDAIAGGININGLDMDASVIMSVFGNDGDFTRISGSKSRNASVGSHTIVQNNDVLLSLKGFGSDGNNFEEAAQIEMQVDGSPGNDDMPGRIVFKTTADGASSPTERLRIGSAGQIGIAGANYGTSGQVLTSQGSGSPVQWATPSGGLFVSYARVCDRKSAGSHGGSFASGDWRTRELNTEDFDPDGIVTLSSNQFTLQAGSYFINAMAPAQSVVNHQLRLRNITDSNNALFGFAAYASQSSGNATDDNDYAFLKGRITLSGAKTFELQHRCNTTRNGAGFGQPSTFGEETYASVEIYKEN